MKDLWSKVLFSDWPDLTRLAPLYIHLWCFPWWWLYVCNYCCYRFFLSYTHFILLLALNFNVVLKRKRECIDNPSQSTVKSASYFSIGEWRISTLMYSLVHMMVRFSGSVPFSWIFPHVSQILMYIYLCWHFRFCKPSFHEFSDKCDSMLVCMFRWLVMMLQWLCINMYPYRPQMKPDWVERDCGFALDLMDIKLVSLWWESLFFCVYRGESHESFQEHVHLHPKNLQWRSSLFL